MALQIIDVGLPRTPTYTSDSYITVNVDWAPRGVPMEPVYYFICDRTLGKDHGYIEIKISRISLEIYEIIVVTEPPEREASRLAYDADVPIVEGSVQIDLSSWNSQWYPDALDDVGDLSMTRHGDDICITFSDTIPSRWVMSGSAGYGVGENEQIVGILIRGFAK